VFTAYSQRAKNWVKKELINLQLSILPISIQLLAINKRMRIPIERKHVKVYPDPKRVIARFFFNGDERGKIVITRVMALPDDQDFYYPIATFAGIFETSSQHYQDSK
jgi:hypothetical protein